MKQSPLKGLAANANVIRARLPSASWNVIRLEYGEQRLASIGLIPIPELRHV